MRVPASLVRFMLEAGFLVLVAAAAAIARLSTPAIIAVMAIAWLLVALVERTASRDGARLLGFLSRATGETPGEREPTHQRPAPADPPTAVVEPSHVRVLPAVAAPAPPAPVAPDAVVAAPPEPEHEPEPEPVTDIQAPPPPEPEPPAPEPEPVAAAPPPPPELRVAPAPPPEPPPPPPPQQPDAVVAFVPRNGPRSWNLWDLERIARERVGADGPRDEERAALLMELRQFASADGMLPLGFDGLVRESFGELIGAARS